MQCANYTSQEKAMAGSKTVSAASRTYFAMDSLSKYGF